MADFCSLCGYGDININKIYNKFIRPDLLEDVKNMDDNDYSTVNVGGICEHCGIVSIGVNNKFEAWSGYHGEKDNHKFGYVDKETLELIILEDDPKYNEQRENMKIELIFFKFESAFYDVYCFRKNKIKSELTSEDFEEIKKAYENILTNL